MAAAATAQPATPAAGYGMISIAEAQDTVLAHTQPLAAETVSLVKALGRTLAADVIANDPLPPFPASMMDGYALGQGVGEGEYEVAFEANAGSQQATLAPGQVAYIATGAPLPVGADRVVPIEQTDPHSAGDRPAVTIKQDVAPGKWVRQLGSDIEAGATVLAAGERVGAAEVGILATVGAAHVQVHRMPHIAILSTGDELVSADTAALEPGRIRDANRPMLLAAVAEAGASVLDFGIIPDSAGVQGLESALDNAIHNAADVLITSGGVSMGDKDFVKPLLESRGTVHFGKVLMKPGKPLTFATIDHDSKGPGGSRRLLVFGLPGNPVSSLVTFALVVLPCLRKLAGWKEPLLRRVQAVTTRPLKLDPVRPEYHRATLHWRPGSDGTAGTWVAESTGGQLSSRLLSMRSASALLELPKAVGVLPAGATVSALLIGDLSTVPVPAEVPMTAVPTRS